MKYFLDTEFLEGTQKKRLFGFPYGNTPNTIDLISIGIVAEDGREYYAISKDFNLKEAWNRYQLDVNKKHPLGPKYLKNYWIRNNVLLPIFKELCKKSFNDKKYVKEHLGTVLSKFSYSHLKSLINWYGKTNKEIANDIVVFVYGESNNLEGLSPLQEAQKYKPNNHIEKPEFYAYYADYDWVVFCWLFGTMMDLPKGFPMYCRDLKQMIDEECDYINSLAQEKSPGCPLVTHKSMKENHPNYPKQDESKQHNALEDARWDFELYKFLEKILQ